MERLKLEALGTILRGEVVYTSRGPSETTLEIQTLNLVGEEPPLLQSVTLRIASAQRAGGALHSGSPTGRVRMCFEFYDESGDD